MDTTIDALEQNLWALWSRFGRGEGCTLHDEPDALSFETPLPVLPYNAVLRFGVDRDADTRIAAVAARYRDRGVPFVWIVHPTARPHDLGARLQACGLEEAEVCAGMAASLDVVPPPDPPPGDVAVSRVGPEAQNDLLELVAWRWEVPAEVRPRLAAVTRAFAVGAPDSPVQAWVARKQGAPVAKVVLNLAAGAAGIYGVATRPEARGLGLARHLTLVALDAARRAGYTLGVLHSTPMAQALYTKIGFRPIAPFKVFAPPNALHL